MAEIAKFRRAGGHPAIPFDQEIADHICELLIQGHSLRRILKEDNQLPSRPTIFKWLSQTPSFADQYARAREAQADALFDETLDIADDSANDVEERKHFAGDDESPQVNGDVIARAKLRIDTRKWMAGKLRPKKYGDKLDIDQTVGVTGDLGSLMERIATGGKRLGGNDEPKGE